MPGHRLFIKLVKVRAVRGIPRADLKLDEKGLLLYGPSGSGKSSLVDAFEFLLLGTISHLEGKQTLSLSRHGKHVLAQPEDMQVECVLSRNNRIFRRFGASPEVSDDGRPYVEAAQRLAFQLRRSQLLLFIHAAPADRFRALANLIGIEQLDTLELAFKRVHDGLEGEVKGLTATLLGREQEIAELADIPAHSIDEATVLKVANGWLEAADRPPVADLASLTDLATALADSAKTRADTRELVATEQLLAGLERVSAQASSLSDAAAVAARIAEFAKNIASREALSSRDVLLTSQRYLSSYSPSTCPLCGRSIDSNAVLADVARRLTALAELSSEATELRQAAGSAVHNLRELARSISGITQDHRDSLETGVLELLSAVEAHARLLADGLGREDLLGNALDWPTPSLDESTLVQILQDTRHSQREKLAQLRPNDQQRELATVITRLVALHHAFSGMSDTQTALQLKQKYLARARVATSAIVSAKNEVVAEIFMTIKADADRYYAAIHPQEPHGNVTLDMTRRASTDLRMDSFGQTGEDPRAFSSEGHLDSLGLCLFLAFARTFSGDCSLLILDDVVMSIDQGHRARIAELLMSEFEQFQMIITTHDKIWFRELESAKTMFGRSADFQAVEIRRWDLVDGPRFSNHKPRWELVREKVEGGDLTGAGSDTRRNLEWVLQEIAERTQALVPFQPEPRPTVEVLYAPVKARLESLVPHELGPAPTVLTTLESTRMFGNMLTHETIDGDAVAQEEVEGFAKAVMALHEWFSCRTCRAPLSYDRGAKLILCRNPRCRARTLWYCA